MSCEFLFLKEMLFTKTFPLDPATAISVLILLLLTATANQVSCLNLSYTSFPQNIRGDLNSEGQSDVVHNILQVTSGLPGEALTNLSGRILYKQPFKLWKQGHGISSFNSKFIFVIDPQSDPPGEGLAFILTKDPNVPSNSYGQWLGLTNSTIDGSSRNGIVAVEFDTKKSFLEDGDDNHVGVDVNGVKSINQTSLTGFGINLTSARPITCLINYNGTKKLLSIHVFKGNQTGERTSEKFPIISMPLDLSLYLPEDVYVGFSASTGTSTELNCILQWYFSSTNLEEDFVNRFWVRVMIPVLSVFLIWGLISLYLYWRIKRKKKAKKNDDAMDIEVQCSKLGPKKHQLKDLRAATSNFSFKNELGRGGFGIVYRGVLNNKEVAIKRMTNTTKRGKKNLIAEVTTIGSIHHKNLVELMGWCCESTELLLVYEYMLNKSLDNLIFCNESNQGEGKTMTILTWEIRHNIICDVARAIDYLHNECSKRVLHRDIKPSNVLLDSEFNARLGDFGLARTFEPGENTHYTTEEIAGTLGYMAPETFLNARATTEMDIYAFGVLVLVVAGGRKVDIQITTEEDFRINIVDWVWEFHRLGDITKAIDPKLKGEFNKKQAECMLVLGLACCHPNPKMRPSVRTSLQVLMGEMIPPDVPLEKPAFVWPVNVSSFIQEKKHFLSGGMLSSVTDLSGR